MATTTIGELLLHLEVDGDKQVMSVLQRFAKQVNNTGNSVKKFGNTSRTAQGSLSDFGSTLSSLMKIFGAYAVINLAGKAVNYFVDAIANGIKSGLDYNTRIEYLNASIGALVGNTDEAAKLTNDLVILAAETPFAIEHYSKAAKTLLGYGVAADDVIDVSKMLGNVAMGNTTSFDRLALAYGQVMAKGKLQAEEVRQMVNQGFNPLQYIAEKTGMTMAELSDEMRAGNISAAMVTEAFKAATSEGGRFDGSMEALSKTFQGQKEKIQEYGEIFWGNVTKPLYDILASDVLPWILENIKKLTAGVDELYGFLGKLVPKIEDFINAFKTGDIEDLYNALKKLIPKQYEDDLVRATVVTLKIRDALIFLKDKATIAFEYLKENGKKAFDFWETQVKEKVLPIIEDLIDDISKLDWDDAKESLDSLKEAFILAEPYLKMFARFSIREVIDATKGMWNIIKDAAKDIPTQLSLIMTAGAILADAFTIAASIFKGDTDSMKTAAKDLKKNVSSYFSQMSDFVAQKLGMMGVNLLITVRDMNRDSNTWTGKMVAESIDNFLYLASHSSQVWNTIKFTISGIVYSLYLDTVGRVNTIKSKVVTAWNTIKTTTSTAWNKATNAVTTAIAAMYKAVYDKIETIKRIVNGLKTTLKSAFDFSLYNSGSNLMKSLISGIKSQLGFLASAAAAGANIIGNLLGWHSPTKEGAGKDSDKWIPNLMNMLIKGFYDYSDDLSFAARYASSKIATGMNPMASLAGTGSTSTVSSTNSFNIVVNANSTATGQSIGKQLISELNRLGVLTHK